MSNSPRRRGRISETDQLIGRTLRSLREQRNFSPEKLADALRISPAELTNREEGRASCAAGEIWKAALALKVPVQTLFHGVHADNFDLAPLLSNLDFEEQLLTMLHTCKPEHQAEFMDIILHETAGLRYDLP